MIRILLDVDGLLRRFGRPVPDAVGLVAALQRLQGGLARRMRTRPVAPGNGKRQRELAVDITAVRFGSASTVASLGGDFVDLPFRVLAGVADLAPGDLCFTTSHTRFAAAQRHGTAAYKVGLGQVDGGRGVDFSDVSRVVEEALRIPTARPMSPATRTGGLLAIPAPSRVQARTMTLEAMRSDLHADWVTLADHLLLHTENPDLEDHLAERPGVRRLSYGVRRDDLVFEWDDGTSPTQRDGTLFRAGNISLREIASDPPPSPRAEPVDERHAAADLRARRWRDVRRRVLTPGRDADDDAADATGLELTPDAATAYRSARAEAEDALRDLLRAPVDETILPALSELVGDEAAADAWPADGPAQLLAWQTPFASPDAEDLTVLHHHLRSASGARPGRPVEEAGDRDALVRPMASALATAHLLRRLHAAPGVLHVLDLRPAASDASPAPASIFLLTDERSRAHPRVDLHHDDAQDADPSARLRAQLSLIPVIQHGR